MQIPAVGGAHDAPGSLLSLSGRRSGHLFGMLLVEAGLRSGGALLS